MFRQSLQKAFEDIKEGDFSCPKGSPWIKFERAKSSIVQEGQIVRGTKPEKVLAVSPERQLSFLFMPRRVAQVVNQITQAPVSSVNMGILRGRLEKAYRDGLLRKESGRPA